jgi:hypothetical protein
MAVAPSPLLSAPRAASFLVGLARGLAVAALALALVGQEGTWHALAAIEGLNAALLTPTAPSS